MTEDVRMRCIKIAEYIVRTGDTIRGAAEVFDVSKGVVYYDITKRILKLDPALAQKARVVLDQNKAERAKRGGLAARYKYED